MKKIFTINVTPPIGSPQLIINLSNSDIVG